LYEYAQYNLENNGRFPITLPVSNSILDMKTSLLNGYSLSKLDFNYMISYRPNLSPNFEKMENEIVYLFKNINYEHLTYFWEKDRNLRKYHSHILVSNTDDEIVSKIFHNVKGFSSIYEGKRETIVKTEKLQRLQQNNKIQQFIDSKVVIDFSEFQGSRGKIHIEPIVDKMNSCLYVSKFSDRGIISGYLNKLVG
jgi:hypothetical protein